jgi:uncharacterized protein (DUF885 family)
MSLTLRLQVMRCSLLAAALLAAPGSIRAKPLLPQPRATLDSPVQADAGRELAQLFFETTRAQQALDPIGALERGDRLDPAQFRLMFTREIVQRRRAVIAGVLGRLGQIDRGALSEHQRISYDVFRADQESMAAALSPEIEALETVMPFNHFGGFHVEFPGQVAADAALPLETLADFELRLALDRALPGVLADATARFREGMAIGVTEPRVTVRNMIAQIDAVLATPIDQSPFTSPIAQLSRRFGRAEQVRLARAFRIAVRAKVYPAYSAFRRFLADEYLPAARGTVGLSDMPGGARLYRALIARHTTLALEPDEVHRLGLAEVARIQLAMEAVKRELGFAGPLPAFFDFVRTDPRFHPRTTAELAQGFRTVSKQVTALVPRYFIHVPRTPLKIVPYASFRARFDAGGSYSEGTADGSQPGVFFFNTYDVKSRFLSGMTTLYLHEGVPGHHFQISLAQENEELPDFQRFGGNTAFVEGWALYAETLGFEMGLYKDPRQHWGTLDDEMLRAMRLVVDTGIHAQGWSRERAIDYMLTNSGMGRSDATAEVDRYIANPGQALAYKIGALTIQRLRAKAEAQLGARFDIRQFHDAVLGDGALPMPVLEAKIDRWLADQAAASTSAISARVLATP